MHKNEGDMGDKKTKYFFKSKYLDWSQYLL
jgi:hypothetical protein